MGGLSSDDDPWPVDDSGARFACTFLFVVFPRFIWRDLCRIALCGPSQAPSPRPSERPSERLFGLRGDTKY
jgi:hypothetical protein